MEQRKSRFRNLKWVDGTTQEFVSGTFRGCKFQFCLLAKYFDSVNSGSCSHINFDQTVMNRYVFDMPWISIGEKQLIFHVWEVANHWNARVKRFMKKLGSLPSRTDEISLLHVSPKSNCLRKMAQNSRLWCRRELWIKTLQSPEVFCCPRIQHHTLPHRLVSTSRIEILWLREDGGWGNAPWLEN